MDVVVKVLFDGYMLGFLLVSLFMLNLYFSKLLYDLQKDIVFVVNVMYVLMILLGMFVFMGKSFVDMLSQLCSKLGLICWLIFGLGMVGYFVLEQIKLQVYVDIMFILYKGGGQ